MMTVSSILPPGPSLVLSLVPKVFGLPVVVYSTLTVANTGISIWGRIGIAVAASFIQATVQILSTKFRLWRDLRKFGARLFPVIPKKTLLGSDIIDEMIEEQHREGHLANGWTRWTETIGHTSTLNLMGDSCIVTIEPDYIKRVLATEFDNFEKGWQFTSAMDSLLGVGVFNSDGDMWKFHRAMTRPFFSRERVSDFELFARHADEALKKLRDRLREGEAVDAQDLVSRFTLDSATEFLFGSCVNSLSDPLPYSPLAVRHRSDNTNTVSGLFASAFSRVQQVGAHRIRMGWIWPLTEPWKDKIADDMKAITAFIAPIIDNALRQEDERKRADQMTSRAFGSAASAHDKVEEEETLLSHLVKTSRDRKLLQDETLNMLVAGRDTTASTLTWAIYILAMYPNIRDRLREEVLNDVGPNREPTFDDIWNMKYLRAFVNEVLRLFPPVPFNVRTSKNAAVWPSTVPGEKPFYIPAGTSINYSPFVMHRSTRYWGPDAAEFDPDRWLDDRLKKYLIPNPFIFLPFNAGPRICLGQQFAYNETSFFIIRLLQTFDRFEIAEDMRPTEAIPSPGWKNLSGRAAIENVVIKSHLTTFARGGLWVRMREAEKDSAI